jgi:hypothetical protein
MNIPELEAFCPKTYTPICSVKKKKGRAISDPASIFWKTLILYLIN